MKKLLFAICCTPLLFAGCKENDTPINFGSRVPVITTFVASPVPEAAKRQVLVEEFTGQTCPNCPTAHAALDSISAHNPGRVNVVSMYAALSPQSNPPTGYTYDLRNAIALSMANAIYNNIPGLPAAGIDRIPVGGSIIQVGDATWDGIINSELAASDSVTLTDTCTYDAATGKATITVNFTYTQPVSTPQNLSIVIVEDSIIDLQEFPNNKDQTYTFRDVFRDMVTAAPSGDVIQVTKGSDAKEAGRSFQYVYSNYPLPVVHPAINPAHCRVIAFVNNTNGTDLHIMQSAQCKFAP